MTHQPPFTFPKINIPTLELGSVAQGKLRTLQRAGWIIGGYALQQHTDALWPMRCALTTDGYFGMLPDENQPEAAAAETCEISQAAKLRKAIRLLHEVSVEFFVDGHDLEFEDGDHPLVDRVRAFLAGSPEPKADGFPSERPGWQEHKDAQHQLNAIFSQRLQAMASGSVQALPEATPAAVASQGNVREALKTIHDTFKADLDAGYITRDKQFAVSIAHEALSATPEDDVLDESREDLFWRLHSLSKSLESSGRIDQHDQPEAYAAILDAMTLVRQGAAAAPVVQPEPAQPCN